MNELTTIIRRVLQRNNWGLYFKGQPLIEMPVNGEGNIYKINDIQISELEGAISDEFKRVIEKANNQGEAECQETKESSEEMW